MEKISYKVFGTGIEKNRDKKEQEIFLEHLYLSNIFYFFQNVPLTLSYLGLY